MDSQSATNKVKNALLHNIESGIYKEGEAIPTLKELSKELGVSIIAIREAIKLLEGMGKLICKRGSGVYVINRDRKQELPGEPKHIEYSFEEILEVSVLIVCSSMNMLMLRASNDELLELQARSQAALALCQQPTAQTHKKYLYESKFCADLLKICGNMLIYNTICELFKPVSEVDYAVVQSPKYQTIVKIDLMTIESLLAQNANRAIFWSLERKDAYTRLAPPHLLQRRYMVKIQQSPLHLV